MDVPFTVDIGSKPLPSPPQRRLLSYDENAGSKVFLACISAHSKANADLPPPIEIGSAGGIDPLVWEDEGEGEGEGEDEGEGEGDMPLFLQQPPPLETPDEREGVPGEWQTVHTVTSTMTATKTGVQDSGEGMEGWEPGRVPLPDWAVDTRVVSAGRAGGGEGEKKAYEDGFEGGMTEATMMEVGD